MPVTRERQLVNQLIMIYWAPLLPTKCICWFKLKSTFFIMMNGIRVKDDVFKFPQ